jgi:hypothetical protein
MSNVKLIKLFNGMDVIAELVEGSDTITLKNALRVVVMGPSKADPTTPQVGLAPFAEFSEDKEVMLDKSHILCIMNPINELVTQYKSIFGGIIAPSTRLIMPGDQ